MENHHTAPLPLATVYFRCDAGSQIGLGHLIRSLALASMLKTSFRPHFLLQQPAESISGQIAACGFAWTTLPQTTDYLQEAQDLVRHLLRPGDLVVLDGYHFTTPYQQLLRQQQVQLVCIDDLQAFAFLADVIINQAGGVDPQRYQALPHTRLCLGPDYALLRAPFLQAARQPRNIRQIDRVLLNMGGADPGNHTCQLLQELISLAPEVQVEVVTGSAFVFSEALAQLAGRHPQVQLHQNLSAEAMCQLMQSCTAAILPPSSVSYEWCSVGGPLFLFQTADNQQGIRQFLHTEQLATDWADFAAFRQDPEVKARIEQQLSQQRKYFRGQSPKNLLGVFHQLYFSQALALSPAGPGDMMTLFEWVNDPAVRENSFNAAPIPLEVHKIWFENKLKDNTTLCLIARVKGLAAGMIRYDFKEGPAIISYLIAPAFRGKNLGTTLLLKGEAMLQQLHPEVSTLIGHVQQSNPASILSFQRAHYHLSQTVAPFKAGAVVFEKHLK